MSDCWKSRRIIPLPDRRSSSELWCSNVQFLFITDHEDFYWIFFLNKQVIKVIRAFSQNHAMCSLGFSTQSSRLTSGEQSTICQTKPWSIALRQPSVTIRLPKNICLVSEMMQSISWDGRFDIHIPPDSGFNQNHLVTAWVPPTVFRSHCSWYRCSDPKANRNNLSWFSSLFVIYMYITNRLSVWLSQPFNFSSPQNAVDAVVYSALLLDSCVPNRPAPPGLQSIQNDQLEVERSVYWCFIEASDSGFPNRSLKCNRADRLT